MSNYPSQVSAIRAHTGSPPGYDQNRGVVETFVTSYVIFAGLALVLSSPVTYVAWRKNRMATMRNFMIGAFVIALPCAILDVVSERQMAQCLEAGISECLDIGRTGLQFLFVGVFALAAWFNAFFTWRD